MSISSDGIREILLDMARIIEENKQYLTDLDAAIGDGDHGHNMARGFAAVKAKLEENADLAPDALLKTTAMALISNVGGASGPLYGTLFLKGAGAVGGKSSLNLQDLADLLREGVEGVKFRGRSDFGEKTMLDVLVPVQQSLEADAAADVPCGEALRKAQIVAEACVEKTRDMVATKGRASYLGERSRGHIDPGAMSSCLLLSVIKERS